VSEGLKLLVSGETADVDSNAGSNRRYAVATHLSWARERLSLMTRNEYRRETGNRPTDQLLTFNQLDYKLNSDFSLFAKWRYSDTDDRDSASRAAYFEERVVGLAYRPVGNDRFNALAKYTQLSDLTPLNRAGTLETDRTMDVVSLDTAYQATRRLEWVMKAASRRQEQRVGSGEPIETNLFLTIQRANVNVYGRIDFGLEYRILSESEADDERSGWLGEVSWRMQQWVRLGVGYNFTDFSDNTFSQNDYSVRGFFFRVQGLY
jgi:hypothetical protein